MKKIIKIIAAITLLLLFVACGSSKKGCGFTAKADLINVANDTELVYV